MSDHDDEWTDEERAWAREVFGDPPPRDVVPGEGLTLADLQRQNDATGTWVEIETPGEVVEDVDGVPHYVEQPTRVPGMFGGTTVTTNDVDRVGLTLEQFRARFPNIAIEDPPNRKDQDHD